MYAFVGSLPVHLTPRAVGGPSDRRKDTVLQMMDEARRNNRGVRPGLARSGGETGALPGRERLGCRMSLAFADIAGEASSRRSIAAKRVNGRPRMRPTPVGCPLHPFKHRLPSTQKRRPSAKSAPLSAHSRRTPSISRVFLHRWRPRSLCCVRLWEQRHQPARSGQLSSERSLIL